MAIKKGEKPKGEVTTEVDEMYYASGSNSLNQQGWAHLHLLLADELKLRRIKYKWEGMPLVERKEGSRVVVKPSSSVIETRKDVGTASVFDRLGVKQRKVQVQEKPSSSDEEPPMLVPLDESKMAKFQ